MCLDSTFVWETDISISRFLQQVDCTNQSNWIEWLILVLTALERLRQEDSYEFQANLSYRVILRLKDKNSVGRREGKVTGGRRARAVPTVPQP